ncbi:UDP-glycosyltransferase UGT5-like isoform X49 [Planococcus citri]|uniref:UDP-glycosyltransferase UGT5-like isoform X49 n=1 Tax=Planococcus citri TaxID=170843 RepID=UPI0031F8A4E2
MFDSLMRGLSNKGHNVTVYNTFPKDYEIQNYHEVDISHCFSLPNRLRIDKIVEMSPGGFANVLSFVHYLPTHREITSCQPLMDLINTTTKYDVLITEIFHNDFFLLYGWKLEIPVVAIHSGNAYYWHAVMMGLPCNPAYYPNDQGDFATNVEFLQRVENSLLYVVSIFMYDQWRDTYDEMAPRIFGPKVPSLLDVERNISLMLINSHFAFKGSRPMVPNVVEVGGINIEQDNIALPKNIEKFINESKHGVVYFCMGSLLRGETFPPEKREAFLYAFSKIPQRVLWKWEGDVLPGKSDNIMISKWMPQRDILAHPNVKLFISHGGLLGTSEAVYEGVPVLGIPIFGDQRTNIKSLEANGAGELLDYNEISKEVVLEKIQRLLNDPKYKENAKLLSDRYRDRPMSPLDTAVYWTEYVIRHKGAPHLRTAAADMPWYQYLLLDVIAFIVAVLVAGLLIIYYTTKFILRAIYGLICGGGAKKGSSKSDKKKRN